MKACSNKRSTQTGFTLVEIAIVLVIIGLLLGGILKGQEMITNAKIKNVISDFNGITAAVNSYQDRYRALAGDESNATVSARWSGAFGGDGNGVLCTGACPGTPPSPYNVTPATPATNAPEAGLFWLHLRLAGFVAGPTSSASAASTTQPNNAANGIIGAQTTGLGFGSNIICSSNLPDKIAIAVDTQMDDGSSLTGQIRGQLQAGTPNPVVGTAATNYAETGANQYLLCKSL